MRYLKARRLKPLADINEVGPRRGRGIAGRPAREAETAGDCGQMTDWAKAAAFAAAAGLASGIAWAQEETDNRVAAMTDWSVFVVEDPKECFGVTAPKETVNTRDGQVVSVRRGDIRLFVTFRPGAGAAGEVSFTGGYPFASGSTATVEIGDEDYQLFTDGEWAWPASPEEDAEIVAAMKSGAEAVVTAVSSRGTTTTDTFSLMGFTAAMEDAEQRCAD